MKKVKTARIPVNSVVCDFALYPRATHNLDTTLVARYSRRLRLGERPPPIIVDAKSKRVVDGFHRCGSARGVDGEHAEINAELWEYADEREMILDAAKRNDHGKPLTTHDQVHVGIIAREMGADDEQISHALHMSPDKFALLMAERTARIRMALKSGKKFGRKQGIQKPKDGSDDEKFNLEALKRPTKHMANKILTNAQQDVNSRLCGLSQVQYVEHVFAMLNTGLMNVDNELLVEKLRELRKEIGVWLNKNGL